MWIRHVRFWACLWLVVVVAPLGCRETEPQQPHNRDLADGDGLLMPTGSPWNERAIADGSAEWVPFREPVIEEESELEAETAEAPDSPDEGAELEAEIRDAVADYNETAADAVAEDLLEYFVEEQYEALQPWLDAALELSGKLRQLREALETALPDEKDRVSHVCETLEATHAVTLSVASINVSDETEATGTVTWFAEPKECRFVAIEDEDGEWAWFFELRALTPYSEGKPAFDALSAAYDELRQALSSEQTPNQQVLERLEQLAAPEEGGGNDGEEPPAGTDPEAGVEEP